MMGFSLSHLIFTALVVYIALRGYKMLSRARGNLTREEQLRQNAEARDRAGPRAKAGALTLIPCTRCGTYIPEGKPCDTCAARS